MVTKIKEFKQCLKSFGYRPLNDKIFAKPLAFLIIIVEISDDKALFTVQFRNYYEGAPSIWTRKELMFENEDYDIFKTPETLSNNIAHMEYECFASYNPIHQGLNSDPWNFQTPTDLYEI